MAIGSSDSLEIAPAALFDKLKSSYLTHILADVCSTRELQLPGGRHLGRLLYILHSTPAKSLTTEIIAENLPTVHDPHFLRRAGEDIIVYDDIGRPDGFAHLVAKALVLEGRCAHVWYLSGGVRAFAKEYPTMIKRMRDIYKKPLPQLRKSKLRSPVTSHGGMVGNGKGAVAKLFSDSGNGANGSLVHPLTNSGNSSKETPAIPQRSSSLSLSGSTEEIMKALGNDVHPVEPPAISAAPPNGGVNGIAANKPNLNQSGNSSGSSNSQVPPGSLRPTLTVTPPFRESSLSYAASSSPPPQIQQGVGGMVTAAGVNPFETLLQEDPSMPKHQWSLPVGDREGLDTTTNEDDEIVVNEDAKTLLHLALATAPTELFDYHQATDEDDVIDFKRYHFDISDVDEDDELEALTKQTINTPEPVISIRAKQLHLVDAVWYGKVVPFGDVPLPIVDDFLYLGSCFAARPDLLKKNKIRRVLRLGWGFAEPEQYEEDEDLDDDVLGNGGSQYSRSEGKNQDTIEPTNVPMMNDISYDPQNHQQQQPMYSSAYTPLYSADSNSSSLPNGSPQHGLSANMQLVRKKVIYHDFPIEDSPNEPIRVLFEEATALLEEARIRNERILVHCHAGVSRSATIVLAYLIKYHRMTLYDAWNLVYIIRPIVRPNDGFARALQEYEKEMLRLEKSTLPIFWMSESYSYYLEYLEWYARMHCMNEEGQSDARRDSISSNSETANDVLMNLMINQYNISRKIMSGVMSPSSTPCGVGLASKHIMSSSAPSPTLSTISQSASSTGVDGIHPVDDGVDVGDVHLDETFRHQIPDDGVSHTLMKVSVKKEE